MTIFGIIVVLFFLFGALIVVCAAWKSELETSYETGDILEKKYLRCDKCGDAFISSGYITNSPGYECWCPYPDSTSGFCLCISFTEITEEDYIAGVTDISK